MALPYIDRRPLTYLVSPFPDVTSKKNNPWSFFAIPQPPWGAEDEKLSHVTGWMSQAHWHHVVRSAHSLVHPYLTIWHSFDHIQCVWPQIFSFVGGHFFFIPWVGDKLTNPGSRNPGPRAPCANLALTQAPQKVSPSVARHHTVWAPRRWVRLPVCLSYCGAYWGERCGWSDSSCSYYAILRILECGWDDVGDVDGRILARSFYKSVFSEKRQRWRYCERMAEALRDAVKKLRTKDGMALKGWVNFVHYGAWLATAIVHDQVCLSCWNIGTVLAYREVRWEMVIVGRHASHFNLMRFYWFFCVERQPECKLNWMINEYKLVLTMVTRTKMQNGTS